MATNPEVTPELVARVLEGSFPGDLGIELVSIADDEARGRLEVDARHLHPGGYVHGGVWVAFAEPSRPGGRAATSSPTPASPRSS